MMMMMMVNCFCGMVDRWKAFSLISSRDHCQRSSPPRISDTPRAGFEHVQNLSSGLVEWSCAVVITTTPRLIRGKIKWSVASFQYISIALNLGYNKNKLYKTLDYWSKDMLNFNFPGKGLGLVFPPHFACDF